MALFARASASTALLTNNCYFFKLTSHDVMLRRIGNHWSKFSIARRFLKCTRLANSHARYDITPKSQDCSIRHSHVVPFNKDYVPFEQLLALRRREASRSILVQVQSVQSHNALYNYCTQFGKVQGMHHYCTKEEMHFFLVEFYESLSASAALSSATHINYDEIIPARPPMVWFRTNGADKSKLMKTTVTNLALVLTLNGSTIPTPQDVTNRLAAVESTSDQMIALHNVWQLDEVTIRLRFLTAHQLEQSFLSFFPNLAVYPFGSSVNGFGKRGCDLDLLLTLDQNTIEKTASRFVLHAKTLSKESHKRSTKVMETVADAMEHFIPGISNVRRILYARVPIIKYDHALTGLECDLSIANMTAVYMSELLCFYGEVDWRVRPLVFTIRQWAQSVGLTNPSPGRWITNFSITLLVLFYLQQERILPSVDALKNLADKDDVRLTGQSIDCTFLRDVTKLPAVDCTKSLEDLLQGFFDFYSTFDFPGLGISIRKGSDIIKPDLSPLYIENPLETTLNVSKNMKFEELERLRKGIQTAAWILETAKWNEKAEARGILAIFDGKRASGIPATDKRLLNLAALFKTPDHESEDIQYGNKHNNPNNPNYRKQKKGRVKTRTVK